MPRIKLETFIRSNLQTCFDLSRSIDLHKISTSHTAEEAINGRTTGLIGLDEFVTWRAVHFGIRQQLTTRITAFNSPFHFRDEQEKGAFNFFTHDHYFKEVDGGVCMLDVFEFRSPLGPLGLLADKLVLTRYMTKLLLTRNAVIKEFAESDRWRLVLRR